MSKSPTFQGPLDLIGIDNQFTANQVILREGEIGFNLEWAFEGEKATIDGTALFQKDTSTYKSKPIVYSSNRYHLEYRAVISILQASVKRNGRCRIEGLYKETNGNVDTDGTWRFEGDLDPKH